jgi:hypothetical protein
MGLKPWEVDRLTPSEFTGLCAVWNKMHGPAEKAALDAPTDREVAEYRAAEQALMKTESTR